MKKKNTSRRYRNWPMIAVLGLSLGFVVFSFSPLVVRNMDDFIYKGKNGFISGESMDAVVEYWNEADRFQFYYKQTDYLENEHEREEIARELVKEDLEHGFEPKPDPYRLPGGHCHIFSVPRLLSHAICWFIFW